MINGNGFCNNCNKNIKIEKKEIRHFLHFFLILITGGLWGFFYGLLLSRGIFDFGWKCSVCGSDDVKKLS